MLHFEINANINRNIIDNLQISNKDSSITSSLNSSCAKYLMECKQQLEMNNKGWDIFKKITNPYEYIHTSIDNMKISKYRPLSRAFYKMTEMIYFFNLINVDSKEYLYSFHIAEGPGGFIEAVNYYRKKNMNPYVYHNDRYYGMTLVDKDDSKIPGWVKSTHFISNTIPVKIDYGASGDGDLYKLENLDYIYNNHKEQYQIVTGDGGFDFSIDFNKQEALAMKLILSEIIYGLILTKVGGNFVVKIFDLFTICSYEIVYLLSSYFSDVYVCKPETSRYGNSEKYIVCKNKINQITNSQYLILRNTFNDIMRYEGDFSSISILNIDVPIHVKNAIQEINCVFAERQLDNINDTLTLMNNNKRNEIIEELNEKHIQLSIEWCKTHNIQYNELKKQNLFV
jgi:hypothetical protein